ncbi:hypothetical protein M2651_07335 [Clostridium sp. SYSU_GA19001]|uniref:hypothetical protein n=1 Tax=Clostridium caldaquaticum TaxID=2940653 RepID=UPI0020772FA8|nr:hypothetical protein [Clostridium caldaquaticum]MCM8710839.1 hypothetical protein [Clostridium caldaquaticum]
MPVINQISLPKGNAGMTLYGTRNDDSTVTLPDIGFNFNYNGSAIRQLYTSGNTWVGFGASSEHLCINRRDASYNNLYYDSEVEYSTKLFRIRFEGNSSYSSWGSNDLIWELSIFETGVIRLVVEKIPNNGTNSFVNPNVGTQSLALGAGKSYIFTPADLSGKNYTVQEGSYIPCITKFLMVDSDGVKNYQGSTWTKIGDLPLTEEMFKTYGVDILPASMAGLSGTSPALYIYTDNPDIKANKNSNRFFIEKTVTSKPKVIIQNYDFNIHDGKTINKLEAIVQYTKKDSNLNDVTTNGKIRIALSVDSGLSWLTYNINASSFESIDITDSAAFLANGINPTILTSLDYAALNAMIAQDRKLRFAYILDKPTLNDVCKLRKIKILYN